MKIGIPYKDFRGVELKYCLRGIELYVEDPEIILIGNRPGWIRNVTHIPYKDNPLLRFKERNIYEKIMMVKDDFLFFNDDHFLLKPWEENYHFSGTLSGIKLNNPAYKTIVNTIELFGDIKNYFRHNPMFIKWEILKKINVDWGKGFGYCIKSIYCHLAGIEGVEFPDLKIRSCLPEDTIENMIRWRPYFSTGDSINQAMINVLNRLYPNKSKYES